VNIETPDYCFTDKDIADMQEAIEAIERRSAEIKERSAKISNKCSDKIFLTPAQEIMRTLNAKQYPVSVTKPKKDKLLTKYLVYAAKYNNEIVYIGSGVNGRENHCLSGCSHVYELNKLHFKREVVSILVLGRFNEKEESLVAEKALIVEHKPKYNVKDHPHSNSMFQFEVIGKWEKYFKNGSTDEYKSNIALIKELLGRYSFIELISDNGVASTSIRSSHKPEIKTNYIYTMLSCLRGITNKNKRLQAASNLFCTADGRIKLPIEPPEYLNKEETHESN